MIHMSRVVWVLSIKQIKVILPEPHGTSREHKQKPHQRGTHRVWAHS